MDGYGYLWRIISCFSSWFKPVEIRLAERIQFVHCLANWLHLFPCLHRILVDFRIWNPSISYQTPGPCSHLGQESRYDEGKGDIHLLKTCVHTATISR